MNFKSGRFVTTMWGEVGSFQKRGNMRNEQGTLSRHCGVVGLMLAEYEPSNQAVSLRLKRAGKSVVQCLKRASPGSLNLASFGREVYRSERRVSAIESTAPWFFLP